MKLNYAVMGNPIAHSLSPIIHQLFADQFGIKLKYEKILIDLPNFEQQVIDFFEQGGKGLNITLPCKERAFAMANRASSRALIARSANTLWMQGGELNADNTDGVGLVRDLKRYIELSGKSILILGAGGATRGILGELLAENLLKLTIANRSFNKIEELQLEFPKINICLLSDLAKDIEKNTYDLVINATSASLKGERLAIPETLMNNKPFCYDLAYIKGSDTLFVNWAKSFGCEAHDGFGMLVAQAAESFFIWHHLRPDITVLLT